MGGTIEIPLAGGEVALIDAEDLEKVSPYRWHVKHSGTKPWHPLYAETVLWPSNKHLKMHRVITDAPRALTVDHINGNGLDNRKANLRLCTHQQNLMNAKPRRHSSRYKGVHKTREGAWVSQIRHNGKRMYVGRFCREEEAARAYNAAARRLFGEFAWLNDVPADHPMTPTG